MSRLPKTAVSTDIAYELGFRSVDREFVDRRLPVEGSLPDWLSGSLIRNGPGRFEIGDRRVTHWFDGLAMLRRYAFEDGEVRYTNRFLRTEAYERALAGETMGEFGTDAGLRTPLKWLRALGPPAATDNAPVHVARIGGEFLALTEAPRRVAFDPVTLESRGEFAFGDELTVHLATAHHVVDGARGETVGYGLEFGRPHRFHVFRIPDGERRREPIGSVEATGPGYVHSVAVTADHVVLFETPLHVSLPRLLAPWNQGLLDGLVYRPERGTRIVVMDRHSGEVVAEPVVPPFFTFHHVNAFEDGGIVADLIEFEDDGIVRALSFASLSEDAFAAAPDGRLVRYRIGHDGRISRRRLYDGGLELPTVPPAVRTHRHRYVYAQATDRRGANGLVKVDVDREVATEWWERGVYVEEPRMVPRPGGTAEDDGVVLATALDTVGERSLLLAFDATNLEELARAELPHVVPFGFHGRFFGDV